MQIETFAMERMQSVWENQVEFNLSESGVHSLRVDELIDPAELCAEHLGYPQTNGSVPLREAIAALYPGTTADCVLVTNGTAEANFITGWSLLGPGEGLALMLPNYMQLWGVGRAFGATVTPFYLREDRQWAPDLDELRHVVNDRTKLIAICHPNNPTGAILSDTEIGEICRIAERFGAWILADEIYRGAEIDGRPSPSFWGRYDRLLVGGGLSKAYGLPGLRIGWLVGPKEKIADLWRYKDYTTIGPGALNDRLAGIALSSPHRERILDRTRVILRAQLPIVQDWARTHGELFRFVPPRAGAIAYLRYDLDVSSSDLTARLRREKSVLVVPGDQFGMDRFIRIGIGGDPSVLKKGLSLISEVLNSYQTTVGSRA